MRLGDWLWSTDHDEPCRILEVDDLWGTVTCRVWLPSRATVVRVPASRLGSLGAVGSTPHDLSFACGAARILDALEQDALLAPLEAGVIPLPHQLHALQRAMSGDRVRYLLADEVGLGKTIEAGLVLRELKLRGLVRRTLVVAPAGLVNQWVSEMQTHFHETFRLIIPGDFAAWRQVMAAGEEDNLWTLHDQVVCPLDSVKPLDARRGWTTEQLARYNRERFEDLATAGWDLIMVDEAHRLGGSSGEVARYRLGEALAQAAPYLLLLSATPHQGKTDAFRRLIGLLDPVALPDEASVRREKVAPLVIRTEKRRAIDSDGKPLFKPRRTQLARVAWGAARPEQRALYEAVTGYVRDGYNRARQEKRTAIGFLMILMQRLVTSSTAAIRSALERRLSVLELPEGQLSLFPEEVTDDWASLDGQDQLESVLGARLKGLRDERAEVELLLSAARQCESRGPDGKADALLDWMLGLEREEGDPALKVLVFTEFVPTQAMLAEFLRNRGYRVVCLNGSMDLDERRAVQAAFARDARVLISTDAGGEGLNLQFCHVVVNYDLPWNPMKLEQRIGRVDRIGQEHVVRAVNLALEDTVELRVREVLEEKLERILEEFGVDKLSDVLDSEEGELDFDTLYVEALMRPAQAEARALELAEAVRARALATWEGTRVLGATEALDPGGARRVTDHQLPFWTERMVTAYLRGRSHAGGSVEFRGDHYRLCWPDGEVFARAVFRRELAAAGAQLVSLDDPRIRGILASVPHAVPGQPIPGVELPGVSDKVAGIWSLWQVSLHTASGREQRVLPVFVSDDGRGLAPTARTVWDRLIALEPEALTWVPTAVAGTGAEMVFAQAREVAERQGHALFMGLLDKHRGRLRRERDKGEEAFQARRRALGRIGLPQVRQHRLAQLEREEAAWRADLARQEQTVPELSAIALVRVAREGELA